VRAVDPRAAFRKSVLDLAAEASVTNVRRYLSASRLLELARQRAAAPIEPGSISAAGPR
jgi:hypothetical protein